MEGKRTGVYEHVYACRSQCDNEAILSGVGGSQTGTHLVDGDGTHHVGSMSDDRYGLNASWCTI